MTALDFLDAPVAASFRLPPEEALAMFAAKGLRPTFAWQDMLGEAHAASFTVAKMMDTDLLADVHASLLDAMANGTPFRQWADSIIPTLQARGWWGRRAMVDPVTGQTILAELGSPGRLQTIFRTNMQAAYSAGAWAQIRDQAAVAPYLMYDAVDDHRTRPEHAALDGKVYPVDSPFWQDHYPPNGWNCRCGVIQLSADDLEDLGLQVSKPYRRKNYDWTDPRTGKTVKVPTGLDPGWNYNPGTAYLKHLADTAIKKAKALPAALVKPAEDGLDAARKAAEAELASVRFDTSTAAGKWHDRAWSAAPAWLRRVVLAQQEVEILPAGKGGAYAQGGKLIHMGRHTADTAHGRDVWRHEFGHILDHRIGVATGKVGARVVSPMRSSADDFTRAMRRDGDQLRAAGRVTKRDNPSDRAELAASYDMETQRVAGLPDARARQHYLQDRAQALGFDLAELRAAFRENSAAVLEGVAGDARMARALRALELRDGERFIFEVVGRDRAIEAGRVDALYAKAVRESWGKGVLGSLSDLLGAATRNDVASVNRGYWGHTEAYYRARAGFGQQTEAFANLTALAGAPQAVWWRIVERLTPAMAAKYREIMENAFL